MTKHVLSVGNCVPDHSSLQQWLDAHFDVALDRTHGSADTLDAMREKAYDLVLINRLMDNDGSEGLEIIRQIQADKSLARAPVMMITNFPDHQELAIAAGAQPGFGKLDVGQADKVELLQPFLG